jgi:hypothetical protein
MRLGGMFYANLHVIHTNEPFRKPLCEIHGAMLTAGTAKSDLKVIATILEILGNRLADKRFAGVKKTIDLILEPIKEVGYGLVSPSVTTQRLVPEWIGHRAAVEHESAAVACRVFRQATLEGE